MSALPAVNEAFSDEAKPVDLDLLRQVEGFYNREARLLDTENYNDWLAHCMDGDIHYWMPDMDTRRRDDPRGIYAFGETAYFDDRYSELEIRVKRYDEPSAWADNPSTRHMHMIANVEVFESGHDGYLGTFCTWQNVRNRNEIDQDIMHGRREDLLRITDDGFRVMRRRVITVQNVLLTKNLNTFF